MKNIVILYSGGLDSLMMEKFAKLYYPDAKITGLFFDHGQDSVARELRYLPDWVKVKTIDWLGDEIKPRSKKSDPFAGAIYIPGRNLVFCVLAASYYQPDEIWLGTLADENNENATDKNDIFIEKTEDVINYVLSPFVENIQIRFPLAERGWSKIDALKFLLNSGSLTRKDILKTTSCWFHIVDKPCGQCKQCLKRALVLWNFDIVEEHENLLPLDPNNQICMNLMTQYEEEKNPNADEQVMQKLIKAFKLGVRYWKV